jgi:hypothetical protein
MNVEATPLYDMIEDPGRLLGSVGVQFDAIAERTCADRDFHKRRATTHARINGREDPVGQCEKAPDSACFLQGQGVVAHAEPSREAHRSLLFSVLRGGGGG